MTVEKGLDEEVADKIGQWVVLSGKRDLLEKMQKDEKLAANPRMQEGLADMELLFTYLEHFGADGSVSFDLSLARGLDCRFSPPIRAFLELMRLTCPGTRLHWYNLRGRYRGFCSRGCQDRRKAGQKEGR